MYSLRYREHLDHWTAAELDALIARFKGIFLEEHKDDGTHITSVKSKDSAGNNITYLPQEVSGHHWRRGPWIFDEAGNNTHIIGLRPADINGGTLNDYNPAGFDKAVILEITPTASLTITGLKRTERIKRALILGNKGGSGKLITLKHNDSNSALGNRFGLPSDTDVVLDTGQYLWLYYDIGSEIWRAFVTPHQSGGLENFFKRATVTLTNAQIKSLNTTPITVVSAPGVGKWVVPVSYAFEKKITVAYDAAPTMQFRYTNGTDNLLGGAPNPLLNATADRWLNGVFADGGANSTTTDTDNAGIRVLSSADILLGDAANQLKVIVGYYLVDSL